MLSAANLRNFSAPEVKEERSVRGSSRNDEKSGFNRGGITYYSGRLWVSQCPEKEVVSSSVMNRGLRDRDTFISLFPGYRVGKETRRTVMKDTFRQPAQRREGKAVYQEDTVHWRKMDPIKKFTEEYLGKLIPSLFSKTIGSNKKVQ